MVGRKHFIIFVFAVLLIACTSNTGKSDTDTAAPDNDVYHAVCGNGIKDAGEECDDGNRLAGDGCDPDCTVGVVSFCGNGVKEPGETCDGGPIDCIYIDSSYSGGTAYCYYDCRGYNTVDCVEYHPCAMSSTFFDEMPGEWDANFTMKMYGIINDPNNADPDLAFLTLAKAVISGKKYNLGDTYGMYIRDMVTMEGSLVEAIEAVGVGNIQWPVANKLASLWAVQMYVPVDELVAWKEESGLEAWVDHAYQVYVFEVWIGIVGSIQSTRMECVRGLSAKNAETTAFEGAMNICLEFNTEWAVGENMKMMDYSKMLDQDADILAVLNEGLSESDENYRTDVCQCWEQDGTTAMDCEDMKDEFGLGELPDDDAITSDDDVLVEWCGNGIMEAGEECEAGMNLPCVEIDPVLYPNGNAPCKDDCSGWDTTVCVEQNNGNDGAIPDE